MQFQVDSLLIGPQDGIKLRAQTVQHDDFGNARILRLESGQKCIQAVLGESENVVEIGKFLGESDPHSFGCLRVHALKIIFISNFFLNKKIKTHLFNQRINNQVMRMCDGL